MSFTTLIDVESLGRLLGGDAHGAVVVLDCRFDLNDPGAGRQAYLADHIPGARYVDLNRDLAAAVTADSGRHPLPSPRVLRSLIASLGIGAAGIGAAGIGAAGRGGTQGVAYDAANGAFAARAWWLLRWLGMSSVAVLDGGFKAWVASGRAVESGEPAIESGKPEHDAGVAAVDAAGLAASDAAYDQQAVVTAAEVIEALQDPRRLLIDARAPERFAGTIEPLDPVAGHVPGAVNHPYNDNLGPDGRFLPPPELRRRWLARLAGKAPGDVILMCGSGVTACHNLLAMDVAGLRGAKLYAGSWSEWIRDRERPVARGNSQR